LASRYREPKEWPPCIIEGDGAPIGAAVVRRLMNVKTVDEKARKQQCQQAYHKEYGDHFLHVCIPFFDETDYFSLFFCRILNPYG
jgi:hypothetical protein